MPLLKGRFLAPIEPEKTFPAGTNIFTIEHTQEKFDCKDAYEKKLRVYDAPLWTCQCTGHINMSHKDALKSEKKTREMVKEKFPEVFEKTVLSMVHHSSDPLDTLVDRASLQLYEYLVPAEPVTLKLKAASRIIKGSIVKADPHILENGSSPSSDKENSDKASNKLDGPPKSPHKGLPKLAPCKYSFKLEGEDKIINGIPYTDITRLTKVPNKDTVKLFIRCYATRGGYFFNSPWMVDLALCEKYEIKDLTEGDLVCPKKRSEIGKKAYEDTMKELSKSVNSRKSSRSSLSSPVGKTGSTKSSKENQSTPKNDSSKKNNLNKQKSKEDSKQTKLSFGSALLLAEKAYSPPHKKTVPSPKKESVKKEESTPTKSTSSTSSDKHSDSPKKTPKVKTESESPKKTPKIKTEGDKSSSNEEKSSPKKPSPKKNATPKKTPKKATETSDDSDVEEISLAELKQRTPTKNTSKTAAKSQTKSAKSPAKKKKVPTATLR